MLQGREDPGTIVRLLILGSNGTYPTPGRPTSGYLLRSGAARLWIDAGAGTLAALQEVEDPAQVDALLITHEHVDHCIDVFPFSYLLRYGPRPRTGRRLIVPTGAGGLLETLAGPGRGAGFDGAFDVQVASPGDTLEVGEIHVKVAAADHPVPTLMVRCEAGGRAIVYTSDTGPLTDLVGFASGADLLLSEATYQGDEKSFAQHLTASEAGGVARRAGVGRLMLTHVLPHLDPRVSVDEAGAVFGRPVDLAVPGVEVKV